MYSLRFTMGDTLSVRASMSRAFMRIVTAIFEKMLWTDSGVPLTCAVSWVSIYTWIGPNQRSLRMFKKVFWQGRNDAKIRGVRFGTLRV